MQARLITLHFTRLHISVLAVFFCTISTVVVAMSIYQSWCWFLLFGWGLTSFYYLIPQFKKASQLVLWLSNTNDQKGLPSLLISDHHTDQHAKQVFKKMNIDNSLVISTCSLWIYVSATFENPTTQETEAKKIFILRGSTSAIVFRAITLYLVKTKLLADKKTRPNGRVLL